ncbi:MAG: hypothetical protein L7S65_05090 [Schleiferiaceae bacterium]|nr:hypothetical protein [Schleiferiaceae bacterium]
MRKLIILVITLIYTLVSTGAVSFLHFCQHEESVHLSLAHEEHLDITEASVCCHAPLSKPCNSTEKSLDSEDCCETTCTELDDTATNIEFDKSVNFNLLGTVQAIQYVGYAIPSYSSPHLVFNNGPPIYLKYRKLLLYA